MLKFVGLLALVSVAYAAVARYPPEPKPAEFANQEGCYIQDLNRVLPYDQPYYPEGKCEKYICQKSNNETQRETCGAVSINLGCTKSADDLTKNYPDCCGTEVCPPTTTEAPTQAPTTQAPTTQAPTTQAPATQAPTTQPPTTQAPTTQAPTAQAPASGQGSSAYASAQSVSGQAPVIETYTSGPNAQASATAS